MDREDALAARSSILIYQNADPDTRKLIEKEMKYDRVRGYISDALDLLGLLIGFAVFLVAMWVAYNLAKNGHPIVGGVIVTVDLVALVYVFVKGRSGAPPARAAAS
jgi:hypothetical protein